MTALRKLIGLGILLGSAWLMSNWVYKNTNENFCKDRGQRFDAVKDTCVQVKPADK
jgi:hypothetical protein